MLRIKDLRSSLLIAVRTQIAAAGDMEGADPALVELLRKHEVVRRVTQVPLSLSHCPPLGLHTHACAHVTPQELRSQSLD